MPSKPHPCQNCGELCSWCSVVCRKCYCESGGRRLPSKSEAETIEIIKAMIAANRYPNPLAARYAPYYWRGKETNFRRWRDAWKAAHGIEFPPQVGKGQHQYTVEVSPQDVDDGKRACVAAATAALQPKAPKPKRPDRADYVSEYFRVWRRIRRATCQTVTNQLNNPARPRSERRCDQV